MKLGRRTRGFFKSVGLSVASVVITLLIIEIVFVLFVDVTDNLNYGPLPGVGLRLEPGQEGLYIREGIRAGYRVNNVGFNNRHDYFESRTPGVRRVAVVGDSFVEALHVDLEDAFFAVLENELNRRGPHATEVYSFGISGFGTSQVLHLVDEYVLDYSPDAIVYLFIPNDPTDSVKCRDDKHWTQQYGLGSDGELLPLAYANYRTTPVKRILKASALFRFLFFQRRLLAHFREPPPNPAAEPSSPDPCELSTWPIVEALLTRLDALLRDRGIPWLLVWQGEVDAQFQSLTRSRLEAIVERHDLPYYDLSPDFRADFEVNGRGFRIPGDGHWNVDGNRVAGIALAARIEELLSVASASATPEQPPSQP